MASWSDAELGAVFKPIDSAWTVVFIDPLIRRSLATVANTRWLTPSRLTSGAHLLGLCSAGAFLGGWLIAGALLFEIRFFLDCLDGKVARLRSESSHSGALLDVYGDRVVVTLAFIGLAAYADQPWLAVSLATAYLLYFTFQGVRDEVFRDAGVVRTIERVAERGLGARLQRHRIYPTVTSVDVEHAVLLVAPLAAVFLVDCTAVSLVGASVYFGGNGIRFAVSALRTAAELDARRRTDAHEGEETT